MNTREKPLVIAVDDERTNLVLLRFMIEKNGYDFIGISESSTAVDMLLEKMPDLILLDVLMPDIGGFELCGIIKSHKELQAIPIIFVTGKTNVEDKVTGLQAGGVDYVTKPYNEHELRARVKTHIDLALARKQITAQAEKLEQDNHLLRRIFSIIGHDLRSPMSAVKMQLDFIIRGYIDVKEDGFVEKTIYDLSQTADEAFNLLDNLLGWARSKSGILEVIKEPIDLKTVLDQSIRLQQMALDQKNIQLTVNAPDNASAFADFNTIKTVFVNLLSNAIKFTSRGGRLNVEILDGDNNWQVTFRDSGIGISEKQLKKIRNPKKHFSKSGTENESGTGLGLILCQDFLIKNGSHLQIESAVGEGSTFFFLLPKY